MASEARAAFDASAADIQRLIDIHGEVGGTGAGRRHRLEVLNKSAIVLLTAFWEAYCEDIAAEGLAHLVSHGSYADLPVELRKQVAKELKADNHELAVWKLAGGGWKTFLKKRQSAWKEARDRKLNTPKTVQINQLFRETIGLPDMSSAWRWQGMSKAAAERKLDELVSLRGSIAHRGAAAEKVRKADVTDYYEFVRTLVRKTGGAVNGHVRDATGEPLWS